ncbi:hypothetical protein HDV00_011675, partial [Rhizophlyctis rosea]
NMAPVQLLPDILVHLFASFDVSIPDLLLCERVCKQWYTIIRSSHVQIWKAKLVRGFPEGCYPVLYGEENYRDVATLWWAWMRLGNGGEVREFEVMEGVEELRGSEGLMRRSGGVVLDLTTAHALGLPYPCGVRPTGQVVIENDSANKKPSPDDTHIDTVFTESSIISSPIQNLAYDVIYKRPNIAVCDPPDGSVNFELRHWDTGNATLSPVLPLRGHNHFICGSQLSIEYGTGTSRFNIIYSSTTSSTISLHCTYSIESLCAMTESLVAHIPAGIPGTLRLMRLKDRQQLASYTLPIDERCDWIELTRFFIILVCRRDCWVFDMKLNLLYKLPYEFAVPVNNVERQCVLTLTEDWGILFAAIQPRMDVFRILCPKLRSYRTLVTPLEGNEEEKRKGYYFSTIEYPVDGKGRRTGGVGKNRYYWRWLEGNDRVDE